MAKDSKFFNCSEKHELDYVAKQYEDVEAVKVFIKEKCKSGEIKYSTHDKVHSLIQGAGYKKK